MTNGVVDFDNMQSIETLRALLGDEESRRLGFICNDERGVTVLSTAGLGYLLYMAEDGSKSPAECFAAGYQCAAEFHIIRDEL